MPLPSKFVFISVEIHVIDGSLEGVMRKGRHKGCMSSVMLKPHSRQASNKELGGPTFRFKEGVKCRLP